MIRINIELDDQGCLKNVHLSGHADGNAKGNNIICAAVTALSRTFGQIIESRTGIRSTGNAVSEGQLDDYVENVDAAQREWFRGVSDFFLHGIGRLSSEYPDTIMIEYT